MRWSSQTFTEGPEPEMLPKAPLTGRLFRFQHGLADSPNLLHNLIDLIINSIIVHDLESPSQNHENDGNRNADPPPSEIAECSAEGPGSYPAATYHVSPPSHFSTSKQRNVNEEYHQ